MAYQDVKEVNNHLMTTTTTTSADLAQIDYEFGNLNDHPPLIPTYCDEEDVRLETTILEDLNKFCWSQDSTDGSSPHSNGVSFKKVISANNTLNTDGGIYTLTVLNDEDQSATRNRTLEAFINLTDDEENNQYSLLPRHIKYCTPIIPHNTLQSHSSDLDLDSILNKISNQPTSSSTSNWHQFHQNDYQLNHSHPSNHPHQTNETTEKLSPHHHNINQDCLANSEQRCAYNRARPKNDKAVVGHNKEQSPGIVTDERTEECNGDSKQSTLMAVTLGGNVVAMFDAYGGIGVLRLADLDNPSSTHSLDDISLSELDAASYTDDYEKPKRTAKDVAESVNKYCSLDQRSMNNPSQTGIYSSAHQKLAENVITQSLISSSREQSTTKHNVIKKYTKSSGGGRKGNSTSAHSSLQLQSNAVRKERSLLYCNFCNKSFRYKYSLTVHICTHTGESPFACSLCSENFKQKIHLEKHYKSHLKHGNVVSNSNKVIKPEANIGSNTNAKSNYCNFCRKSFKDKFAMNMHILTHTGERPFGCLLCSKSFKRKAHLKLHYKTKHQSIEYAAQQQ